jgi:oligosaccharide repeat unit polymerase
MVLGSSASFLTGYLAFTAAYPARTRHQLTRAYLCEVIHPGRLRVAMVALFLVTVAAFAYEVHVAGNVPMLVDPASRTVANRTFALPNVHYGTISGITVAVLAFFHLWVFGRKHWLLPVVLLLASVGIIFSIMARQQMLLIGFACLIVANYTARRPIGMRKLAGFAVAMFALFLLVGVARGAEVDTLMEASGTYVPEWAKGLVAPYLYFALNFQVLQSLAEADLPPTHGAHTLQPILSLTMTRRLFPLPNVEEEYGWFNTYTYLWPIYSDFGIAGTLAVPLIYGILSAWIYCRLRRMPTPSVLVAYALVAFALLFVFQGNGFAFPMYYVLALEAWLAFRFASRRNGSRIRTSH